MKNKKNRVAVMAGTLFFVVVALGLSGMGTATAATMPELLQFMPPDAHIAIGLPDIAAVEQAGAPLLRMPPLARIRGLAMQLGGDTIGEALANSGIAAAAPGTMFLRIGPGNAMDYSGVLVVDDADKVMETMTSLLGGAGAAIALPDGIEGRFVSGDGVGYFIHGDRFFVASSESLLQQLAARNTAPAEINYGRDGVRDEVVVWTRFDTIEEQNLLGRAPQLSTLEPVVNALKGYSDEAIFAVGETLGKAYVRLAARDNSEAGVSSPGPLGLHSYMDPEAPLLLNLRITPELINVARVALSNNPSTRQIGGYISVASALLGDELAVSLKGMQAGGIPDALIAVKVRNPEAVPNLLRMVGRIDEPAYEYDDNKVYVYPNVAPGTDLHITVKDDTLLVAPGEELLKGALAAFAQAGESGGVPSAIVNQGVYGFLAIDGAKAPELPHGMIPAGIALSDINVALLMGLDNGWRELMLTSPAGFEGVASLLQGIL